MRGALPEDGNGSETRQEQAPGPGRRPVFSGTAVLGVVAGAVLIYFLRYILLVFVLPLIVAYVCTPLVGWLARRLGLKRWVAALSIFLMLSGLTGLALWLTIPGLIHQLRPLLENLRGTVQSLAQDLLGGARLQMFGQTIDSAEIADRVMALAQSWINSGRWLQLGAAGLSAVFGAMLSWILLAYFLFDGPGLARGALRIVPPRRRELVSSVCRKLDPVLRRYFIGVAVIVVYAACAAYLGLGIALNLQHAALLAALTGVLELVPVVGPAISAVVAGLVATHEAKSAWGIVAYVIYAFALRISIDQLFGPLVLGRAASVSPVLVIFAFLTGGLLFGIVGIILAVPAVLTVKVTLATLYEERPANAG